MEKKNDKSLLQLFEGRKVRTVWGEEAQVWFFSVVDVVAYPKLYIKKMRARDLELGSRWGAICTSIRMMATRTCLSSVSSS